MIQIQIDSPVGVLTLAGPEDGRLSRLHFGAAVYGTDTPGAFAEARGQLSEYFAGERRGFELDLAVTGTEFQRRVWAELARIPYGETRTYGELAVAACESAEAGSRAARAVGSANHRNPLAIVIPCHRVVGADGRLVGFAGGLDTKRRLLDLEAGRLALV